MFAIEIVLDVMHKVLVAGDERLHHDALQGVPGLLSVLRRLNNNPRATARAGAIDPHLVVLAPSPQPDAEL